MLESDFDLKITHLRRDKDPKETYSQFFFRKGIRGAILRSTSNDRDVARLIGDEGFPAVVLGDRFDHPRLAFAYNESAPASAEGVEHLISLGHRRIAFAANDTDDGDHIDRLEAYRADAHSHGIYDQQLEFRVPAHRLDGAQLMRKMMSMQCRRPRCFIADPLTACGAINEAHKLGLRIPDEMSILGFDDSDTRFSVVPDNDCRLPELARVRPPGVRAIGPVLRGSRKTGSCRGLGKAWLEINHTTARVPALPVRIMPNGERLPVAV